MSEEIRVTVAMDGSGDFRNVQAAVDSLSGSQPAVILIKRGCYRERVVIHHSNVRLVGEDREETVITWSACAKDPNPDGSERGTFLSYTLLTAAPDITVENLTVRNDAGDGRVVGQAVAVYTAGDRGIWQNCSLIACQDTLFCGPLMPKVACDFAPYRYEAECVPFVGDCPPTESRQYFQNCMICGDVDFIFGPYRCWFEGCHLVMNQRGGWYTAANSPEEQPYGLVFSHCHLSGDCPERMAYLGRPWRRFARTLFLACEMDDCVSPVGFTDWDEIRVITERCGEWGTTGARADVSMRHPSERILTDPEAAEVTRAAVLNGWEPR